MWHYRPSFAEPDQPDASKTIVRTPAGRELDVVDPALAAELGFGARVIKHNRGMFDIAPLSLLSTGSLAALQQLVGPELRPERFRPNLLVQTDDGSAFAEDGWVGSVLRIGALAIRIDQRDQRCVMINVDPDSTQRDASVLRAVAQQRESCFGVYGSVVTPGCVAVGDPVSVER